VPVSRQPMVGRDEAHFLIDRMEERREIRMHCTISGMFVHWQLAGGVEIISECDLGGAQGTKGADPGRSRRNNVMNSYSPSRFSLGRRSHVGKDRSRRAREHARGLKCTIWVHLRPLAAEPGLARLPHLPGEHPYGLGPPGRMGQTGCERGYS
jgi:hypothetical protein